jgi:hypothetical protein
MPLSISDAPSAGPLKRVQYLFEDGLRRPVAVALTFEHGILWLAARPEDDQLVTLDEAVGVSPVDVSRWAPWKSALGRSCLWAWTLTNHTGHTDGAQLLFAAPPATDVSVQLVVAASQVDVCVVGEPLRFG